MPLPTARRVKCPRCGRRGYLHTDVRGSNVYYYVSHYEDGKRSKCHLGPKVYKYASVTHEFPLMGQAAFLNTPAARLVEYMQEIAAKLAAQNIPSELQPKLLELGNNIIKLAQKTQKTLDQF
ncbi:MAG: hypothetical protein ACK4SY_09255 [Pyrobaculum sp.]